MEIIKGNCLISVVSDYLKLKKYNVNELWDKKDKELEADDKETSEKTSPEKKTDETEKVVEAEKVGDAETVEVKVE